MKPFWKRSHLSYIFKTQKDWGMQLFICHLNFDRIYGNAFTYLNIFRFLLLRSWLEIRGYFLIHITCFFANIELIVFILVLILILFLITIINLIFFHNDVLWKNMFPDCFITILFIIYGIFRIISTSRRFKALQEKQVTIKVSLTYNVPII